MATAPKSSTSAKDIKKDTVYIDIDDEITSIIEKVQNSPERIVALVLPKRASVFQSVVNMKLLKRSAEKAKKNVVLITSESGLLPLAGAVGLFVAPSLQSKPSIPQVPSAFGGQDAGPAVDVDSGEELEGDEFNPDAVADEPIGKLAGSTYGAAAGAGAAGVAAANEPETIELGDDEPAAGAGAAGAAALADAKPKKGKDKKLKIPNFNKFRLFLMIGLALIIVVIGGFIYANATLSKAVVTLTTNSTDIATKVTITLDPKATAVDPETATLPAKIVTKKQTATQQVSTSGQKNNGTKASGTIALSSQTCGAAALTAESPNTVPAGTGVSSGGKTFITQQSTTFPDSGVFKSGCVTYTATDTTSVVAQTAGADFNIAPASFAVAGRSDITAKSSEAFTGGTDNIIKIVAQADIDSAKAKLTGTDSSDAVKSELTKNLQTAGYKALPTSLNTGEPAITNSAAVGDQADTVTVTSATTYTMYGLKEADVKQIVTATVKKEIDTSKQQIIKDGVATATYKIDATAATGPIDVALAATSLAGPKINIDTLPAQLAGKKTGEVQSTLKAIPGVTDVTVKYSPFWVSKIPGDADKVQIVVEKSAGNGNN